VRGFAADASDLSGGVCAAAQEKKPDASTGGVRLKWVRGIGGFRGWGGFGAGGSGVRGCEGSLPMQQPSCGRVNLRTPEPPEPPEPNPLTPPNPPIPRTPTR